MLSDEHDRPHIDRRPSRIPGERFVTQKRAGGSFHPPPPSVRPTCRAEGCSVRLDDDEADYCEPHAMQVERRRALALDYAMRSPDRRLTDVPARL